AFEVEAGSPQGHPSVLRQRNEAHSGDRRQQPPVAKPHSAGGVGGRRKSTRLLPDEKQGAGAQTDWLRNCGTAGYSPSMMRWTAVARPVLGSQVTSVAH